MQPIVSMNGPVSPLDPSRLELWSGRPLRYTRHALERCGERGLPVLESLPSDARLADVDVTDTTVEAAVYKVAAAESEFFLILSADGYVVTTFGKQSSEYARWRSIKERRRRRIAHAA